MLLPWALEPGNPETYAISVANNTVQTCPQNLFQEIQWYLDRWRKRPKMPLLSSTTCHWCQFCPQSLAVFLNFSPAPQAIVTGFPGGSVVKNLSANEGDTGSIPGPGRSPLEGNGNPLHYSCLGILTEVPGRPQAMGWNKRVGYNIATKQQQQQISLLQEVWNVSTCWVCNRPWGLAMWVWQAL